MKLFAGRRPLRVALLAAGLFAGAAGIAAATTAVTHATGTTIQGCQNNGNVALRVVDAASDCRHNETPLSWNVQVAAGPAGPAGSTGPAGPAGPAGPQGPIGPTG